MRPSIFSAQRDVELIQPDKREVELRNLIPKLESRIAEINKKLVTHRSILKNSFNVGSFHHNTVTYLSFKSSVATLEERLDKNSRVLNEAKAELAKLKDHTQQVNEAKEKLKNFETQEQLMDISVCAN